MLQSIRLYVLFKWVVLLLFALRPCVTLMFYACLPLTGVPTRLLNFSNFKENAFEELIFVEMTVFAVICAAAYLGSLTPIHIIIKQTSVLNKKNSEVEMCRNPTTVSGDLVAFTHYGVSSVQ